MTAIKLQPEHLDRLGVDFRSILDSEKLSSLTFGWGEDGRMFLRAELEKTEDSRLSYELAEHKIAQLMLAFESAVAAKGILARIGKVELFPANAGGEVTFEGRSVRLPKDWQE